MSIFGGGFAFGNYGIGFDPDALRFLNAAGIQDQRTSQAINNLVVRLKNANLWTRYQIIYPFAGITSATMKWNLKNPQDTNAAYRIVFNNGGTFNQNAYTSDGVNDSASTFLIGTSIGTSLNNFSISYYIKDAIMDSGFDTGTRNNTQWLSMNFRTTTTGDMVARAFNNTATLLAHSHTTGLMTVSRSSSANFFMGINDTTTIATQTSVGRPAYNLVFGAYNDFGTVGQFQNRNFQFYAVGSSITAAEHEILWNTVAQYQSDLGR
jgi:hypothetical protein